MEVGPGAAKVVAMKSRCVRAAAGKWGVEDSPAPSAAGQVERWRCQQLLLPALTRWRCCVCRVRHVSGPATPGLGVSKKQGKKWL
jgi:hypothetical protein